MLAPRTQIRLFRSIQLIVVALILVAVIAAASGFHTNFVLLDSGIALGLVALAILMYLMQYPAIAALAVLFALLYTPVLSPHFTKVSWVILDIFILAAVMYVTYWTTDPHKKGIRFEKYVAALFPEPHFMCMDRTHDGSKALDRRVLSDADPDFVFRNQKTGKTFAVECKWRGRWAQVGGSGEMGLWWNLEQAAHYRVFGEERGMPVFVALGIGGSPNKPKEVYFMEISKLSLPFLKQSLVRSGKTAMEIG